VLHPAKLGFAFYNSSKRSIRRYLQGWRLSIQPPLLTEDSNNKIENGISNGKNKEEYFGTVFHGWHACF
jgi:hypothetical protein